jgi:hypothetical protein
MTLCNFATLSAVSLHDNLLPELHRRPEQGILLEGSNRGGFGGLFVRFRRVSRRKLLAILPDNRRNGFETNTHPAKLVDVRTFGRNPPYNILSRQNRCHYVANSGAKRSSNEPFVRPDPRFSFFPSMISEKDIWRAATLMLRRYGDKALEESATRADQLDTEGDPDGAATWR